MKSITEQMYIKHHEEKGRYGFSCEIDTRASIYLNWIGRNKQILDIGCRDGTLTGKIINHNKIIGLDIDSIALKKCKDELGIEVLKHDINTGLPFKRGSFEAVILGEVLEHTIAPEFVLSEIARILKSGGLLVGSVPNMYRLKNRLLFLLGRPFDHDPTHLHLFSPEQLKELLGHSFRVIEIRFKFSRLVRLYPRLFGNTMMFYCNKKK